MGLFLVRLTKRLFENSLSNLNIYCAIQNKNNKLLLIISLGGLNLKHKEKYLYDIDFSLQHIQIAWLFFERNFCSDLNL